MLENLNKRDAFSSLGDGPTNQVRHILDAQWSGEIFTKKDNLSDKLSENNTIWTEGQTNRYLEL